MDLRLPRDRRRPALLRAAGRLHPAPRPGLPRPGRAGRAAGLALRSCIAGGRLFRFIPNPTFDPIIVPGCLDLMFRGQMPEGVDPRTLAKVEPLSPRTATATRARRTLDEQGLDDGAPVPDARLRRRAGAALRHPGDDGDARARSTAGSKTTGASRYEDRIITAPMISLADPDAAVRGDRLAARARRAHRARAPRAGARRARARLLAGRPRHDPVWARLAEANIPVAFHLGDSGYDARCSARVGRFGARSSRSASVDVLSRLARRATARSTTRWPA